MAYLSNTAVNLLNLHYGVHALASGMGGVFFGVFLLRAGVPAEIVLATFALILAGRFALRPLILPLAIRWGLKPLVMAGCVITALQYPILARVEGPDATLLLLCVVSAIGDVLYWTTYHAYFAALTDAGGRARQTSARESLAAIIGIIAPLIGGWALATAGPVWAFGAVALVLVLSALPLIGAPDVPVARDVTLNLKDIRRSLATFAGEGWMAASNYHVWQIVLFVTLSQSFTAYAGAAAFAAFVGAVSGLFIGGAIDAGRGQRAAAIALGALAAVLIVRGMSLGQPVLAVFANALGAFVNCLYAPTLMTAIYNEAVRSPCPLRFHVATEAAFDVGAGAGLLVAAGIVALGGSLSIGLLIGLFGTLAVYLLLRSYYAGVSAPAATMP